MNRHKFSVRAWGAALVCSVLVVAGSATTAGATVTTAHATSVTGQATHLRPDGLCAPNPNAPAFPEWHIDVVGSTKTRVGPAKIRLHLCEISSSALGGEQLHGEFSIATFAGTLSGVADGFLDFDVPEGYNLTLTVERGSFLLSAVRGTLTLTGNAGGDLPGFTGTLTSDLQLSWWRHSIPFSLT